MYGGRACQQNLPGQHEGVTRAGPARSTSNRPPILGKRLPLVAVQSSDRGQQQERATTLWRGLIDGVDTAPLSGGRTGAPAVEAVEARLLTAAAAGRRLGTARALLDLGPEPEPPLQCGLESTARRRASVPRHGARRRHGGFWRPGRLEPFPRCKSCTPPACRLTCPAGWPPSPSPTARSSWRASRRSRPTSRRCGGLATRRRAVASPRTPA